jgi:succinyl-CoA synthetase beta subunit
MFSDFGIAIPKGIALRNLNEITTVMKTLGDYPVVVKAQVLAGGRGKAGGIQFAKDQNELEKAVKGLLGKELTTYQSGDSGEVIRTLYIEEKSAFDRSLYLGLLVDRTTQKITIIASSEGGMEIEEVAAKHPEKILTRAVPVIGYSSYIGRNLAQEMGLTGSLINDFGSMVGKLYDLFIAKDAALLEINPLVITKANKLVALDGKLSLDDNASYRQKALVELYQSENRQADNAMELKAQDIGVNFVSLDGNIGCMVNGAGLAMSTMDAIKLFGGDPANFLDVGGGVSTDQVRESFKLLTSSPKVRGIFVNIFGGIVQCDKVANGIVQATRELALNVPVVVRLEGTNVEAGKKILKESGLNLSPADGMEDGAKLIVEKVKTRK